MPNITVRLLPLLLASVGSAAVAGLTSVDNPIFGTGAITRDSIQGLDWLTPNATLGLSFVETQALLASDTRFAGFRVATLAELAFLYFEAAIPDINTAGYGALYGTTANVYGVSLLQGLTGITYSIQISGQILTETAAFVGEPFTSPFNGFLSVYIGNTVLRPNVLTPSGTISFASAYTTWGSATVGTEYYGVGTWLVASVPEPSQWGLIVGGLFILLGLRARRAAWRSERWNWVCHLAPNDRAGPPVRPLRCRLDPSFARQSRSWQDQSRETQSSWISPWVG